MVTLLHNLELHDLGLDRCEFPRLLCILSGLWFHNVLLLPELDNWLNFPFSEQSWGSGDVFFLDLFNLKIYFNEFWDFLLSFVFLSWTGRNSYRWDQRLLSWHRWSDHLVFWLQWATLFARARVHSEVNAVGLRFLNIPYPLFLLGCHCS